MYFHYAKCVHMFRFEGKQYIRSGHRSGHSAVGHSLTLAAHHRATTWQWDVVTSHDTRPLTCHSFFDQSTATMQQALGPGADAQQQH